MRRIELPSVRILDDLDARSAGADLAPLWRDRRPEIVRLDFGDSSLRRCVLALPVVDAIVAKLRGARVRVLARRTAAALVRAHMTTSRAGGSGNVPRCDPGEVLTIDLRPGIGRAPEWFEDGPRARLRIRSAPFPWRWQSHAEHWIDGAVCAGLWPAGAIPTLRLSDRAREAARQIARAQFGLLSGPIVAVLPSPRERTSWGAHRLAEVLRALELRIGARGISVAGPRVPGAIALPPATPPDVRAAMLALCCVAVGDDDGWSHVAAAVGASVVTVHGRTCPERRAPLCSSRSTVSTPCRHPACHRRARAGRADRCLRCLEADQVVAAAERLAAERWPWDRLARLWA